MASLIQVSHRALSSPSSVLEHQPKHQDATCESCQTSLILQPLNRETALRVCPTCGHIVRDLALSGALARGHAWGGHAGMDRIRLALTWRRLSKHLSRLQDAASTPLDVLELGYGRGVLLQKMIDAGYRVRGVERHLLRSDDSSPTITGATLYNTTAEECTLSESSYDLICAIHVVEHLTDPNTVFHKIVRALRPGGIFYCITPNAESYGLSLFRQYWWNLEDPTHYRFFSRRSLASMLCTAGFRAVQTNIVIEDSVTLEANSALRALSSGDQNHGILHTRVARAVSFALTPVMLLARLFMPRLSPSIEAIAIKGR